MLKPFVSQLDNISYLPDDTWQERLGPGMDGSMAGGTTLDQDCLALDNSCLPTHLNLNLCQDPEDGLGAEGPVPLVCTLLISSVATVKKKSPF